MSSQNDNPDYLDQYPWESDFNNPRLSWMSEHTTLSFEDEFDEGRTVFSASEHSPGLDPFSHGPGNTSGFVGEGVDMSLYDELQPESMEWLDTNVAAELLLPYPSISQTSLRQNDIAYSPSHALREISIGEPSIPTITDQVDPQGMETVSDVMGYFQGDFGSNLGLSDMDGVNASSNEYSASSFLAPIPPVTISPCSRTPTPSPNPQFTARFDPPSPGSLRKRHYSESATTRSHLGSPHNIFTLNATPLSYSPLPITPGDSSQPRLIRRASSRKKRGERDKIRCPHCPDPGFCKRDQKLRIIHLPAELLIEIFTFACSSLPTKKAWTCEHMEVGNSPSTPRRFTMNGAFPDHQNINLQRQERDNSLVNFYQRKFNLPRHLRLLQARTILALQLTCREFRSVFETYANVDNTLWKEATIGCWGHLPKTLAAVQGWNKSSQTCWKNVFGVFMRSDNGMFKRKTSGGVGGVESFGGKNGFKGAVSWIEEKRLRMEATTMQQQEAPTQRASSGKGKERQTEDTEALIPHEISRRKLLLACVQPGPDAFTVRPLLGEGEGYEIGVTLRNGENVFVKLDENGTFSKARSVLPHGLRRSKKGRFPPDCFSVIGDRFKVVKVEGRNVAEPNSPDIYYVHSMDKTITWDLHCVPEFTNDKRASVARCEHSMDYLVFNMFASREGFIEGLDKPQEDNRVFCVFAEGQLGPTGIGKSRTWPESSHGPIQNSDCESSASPRTVFKWQRTFIHPNAFDFHISQGLHYIICNLKLNSTCAVILVRWNIHSKVSYHEFVDRSFQVLDLETGSTLKVLQYPNFHWDFRHHDMTIEYNVMRYYKMRRMYNAPHAGNRVTRVHEDQFTLDDQGRLVSGSHDYCIWMWDLNAEYDENAQSERVFNPVRNDAGINDPFKVLDDFYWSGQNKTTTEENSGAWDTSNERAGWWVKTPNQVLCFWHNVATSKDGRWFAAVRAGRMFVWDLEDTSKVQGFSCALGTYMDSAKDQLSGGGDGGGVAPAAAPQPTVEARYLGKLLNPRYEKRLKSWHVWNGIIPEQGLWLMYTDGKVVYLDRDDILVACGLSQQGKQWEFSRGDFGNLDDDDDDDSEDSVTGGNTNDHRDDDECSSAEESDGESNAGAEYDSAVVFVDNNGLSDPWPRSRARRKRRRTSTLESVIGGSLNVPQQGGDGDGLPVVDVSEQFMFDNELPDAETWEKMDDEGWLRRVREEQDMGPGEGGSGG